MTPFACMEYLKPQAAVGKQPRLEPWSEGGRMVERMQDLCGSSFQVLAGEQGREGGVAGY